MQMRKLNTILLASVALLAQAGTAHAASEKYENKTTIEKKDDGSYERKDVTTKTDATGNTVSLEKKMEVEVDPNGNFEKTVKTKEVSDPKGLNNKHVVETNVSQKLKGSELVTTREKSIDGKNIIGEKDKYKTDTKVVQDDVGNYDEKTKIVNTDAVGTKTTYEKKAVVNIDAAGKIAKATTTKEIDDPKGLMNKKTVATSNTQTIENGTVTSGQDISVDGKVVDSQRKVTAQ